MSEVKYSVHGRQAARFGAVQILFQHEDEPVEVSNHVSMFLSSSVSLLFEAGYHLIEIDASYFKELVLATFSNQQDLDDRIKNVLSSSWKLERLDPVARAILRVAACELVHFPLTPIPVVINEYVEIAKGFFEKPDVSFIHASLDKISKNSMLKREVL